MTHPHEPRSLYRGAPIEASHPRQLATIAQPWGIDAAPWDSCRVLELGCGVGTNILPMAARAPASTFVGVDRDPEAILAARAFAERAGVSNVEFIETDVATLSPPGDSFDYVIAHGLFSWITDSNRDATLALCRSATHDRSISYISYNAMPAWGFRDAIRTALVGVTGPGPQALRQRLEVLRNTPAINESLVGKLLHAEIDAALSQTDSYLEHEYRCSDHRAFTIREFCDHARRHQLQYLDDVAPTGLDPSEVERIRSALRAEASDPIDAEQLFDLAIARQFRATLLVHDDLTLSRASSTPRQQPRPSASIPTRPQVLALTQVEAELFGWVSTSAHSFRPLHPLHAQLLAHLDGTRDPTDLVELIATCVIEGSVQLPTEHGGAPTVAELKAGLPVVVEQALQDFAHAGLFAHQDSEAGL